MSVIGSPDDRELGVMLDRVAVQIAPPMRAPDRRTAADLRFARARARGRRGPRAARRGRDRRPFRRRRRPAAPQRILLLRLERIGDLLMALPAIAEVRALRPRSARSISSSAAGTASSRGAIAGVTLRQDPGCGLAGAGGRADSGSRRSSRRPPLAARALRSGDQLRAGYPQQPARSPRLARAGPPGTGSGGGGPLLDVALEYDPRAHTADNARRLVQAVFGASAGRPSAARGWPSPRLRRRRHAAAGGCSRSAGRCARQRRTRDQAVAPGAVRRSGAAAVDTAGATIVLTGAPGDRMLVDRLAATLPADRVVDAAGDPDLLDRGGDAQPPRRAVDRRHRTDAPRGCRRHARDRGVRAIRSGPLRTARAPRPGRARRASLQSVQPHPASAGAVRRPHAGLPRVGQRRAGVHGRHVHPRHPSQPGCRHVRGSMSQAPGDSLGVLLVHGENGRAAGAPRGLPHR